MGQDRFTYTVTLESRSEATTVDVSVGSGYRLSPDYLTNTEDSSITANVLTGTNGASIDLFSSPATLVDVQQPSRGTVTFLPDGTLTYTPQPDYFGNDFFYYYVESGGERHTSSVTVKTLSVRDIVDDTLSVQQGGSVTANLMTGTNGASADNFEGAARLDVVLTGYGDISYLADGTFTFTPYYGFSGQTVLEYQVVSGTVREAGSITINVASNGTATDDSLNVQEDTSITANVVTGTNGATSDNFIVPFTLFYVSPPVSGTVTFLPDGTITYVPNADFNGDDIFSYILSTPTGYQTAQVHVHVSPVADVVNDSPDIAHDASTTLNLITGTNGASADNFEGVPLLVSVTQGANGTVTGTESDGTVIYTPLAGFSGRDTFTYTVISGGVMETGTVTVNVIPDTPQILLHAPTGTYHLGRETGFVDPQSEFQAAFGSNPDFSHAVLTVTVTTGHTKKTILSVRPKGTGAGQINLDGKNVRYGSTVIGTYSGGRGRHPDLVVELNSHATAAAVEDLLQRINYENKLYVPTVTVQLQITNISGQDTNIASRQFEVVKPTKKIRHADRNA